MKRLFALLLAVLLLAAAAGCTTREEPAATPEPEPAETAAPTLAPTPQPSTVPIPEATPEVTAEPSPEPTSEPTPVEELKYRNFFNGTPIAEPDYSRPFAVMINNIKEAQPQCGISAADIIYEVLAEGGVTRMMAIFSDIRSAEHLGSIRSIRPYYIDISLGYGAISVHAGGSDDAYTRIRREKFDDIDGVNSYPVTNLFYRDQARRSSGYAVEHTLFTEGDRLYETAEKLGFNLTLPENYDNGLRFEKDATPKDGQSAKEIKIEYNIGKKTDLIYHEDTGLYTAQQLGGDYIDGNTKEALTFRNLIVIEAYTKMLDNYGRLRVDLIANGEGYYVCGGKYEPITWKRDSVDDCFHYYRADGSELTVSEGKTFISVLARNQSVITFE